MTDFHHVVLFRLYDDADLEVALAVLDRARPTEGLVSWQVQRSLDERKGPVIAQISVFESEAAFQSWRASQAHQAAAAHLREAADWLVADWEA